MAPRLMLNSAPFGEPAGREQMSARFAALGIDPARLDLVYTSPQPRTWAAYGEIDIALDPFPHNAGTTTIEALWQGVPVLSLAGRPTVGRFGAAILHAVGLDDWVTNDVDAYVARAVSAAADIDALARLRAELRARFAASPLRDAAGLAREIEAAYRGLWRRWCNDDKQDVRQALCHGRRGRRWPPRRASARGRSARCGRTPRPRASSDSIKVTRHTAAALSAAFGCCHGGCRRSCRISA